MHISIKTQLVYMKHHFDSNFSSFQELVEECILADHGDWK